MHGGEVCAACNGVLGIAQIKPAPQPAVIAEKLAPDVAKPQSEGGARGDLDRVHAVEIRAFENAAGRDGVVKHGVARYRRALRKLWFGYVAEHGKPLFRRKIVNCAQKTVAQHMRAAVKKQRLDVRCVVARKVKEGRVIRRGVKAVSFLKYAVEVAVPVAPVARAEAEVAIAQHRDRAAQLRLDYVGKQRPHRAYELHRRVV
ncbi:unknown [Anaerotruncus sp. CAG:390]|nr:unknown [Anaerotruncus sp. CAG:390]